MRTGCSTRPTSTTGCCWGLKGALSEIERYQIAARMQPGRLNKVQPAKLGLEASDGPEPRLDLHSQKSSGCYRRCYRRANMDPRDAARACARSRQWAPTPQYVPAAASRVRPAPAHFGCQLGCQTTETAVPV